MYHDVTLTTQELIREVTVIQPSWLTELASHYFELKKPDGPKTAQAVPSAALDALRSNPAALQAKKNKGKRKPEFGTETRDDDEEEAEEELLLPTKIVFKGKQSNSSSVFAAVPRKRRAGMGL